MKNEISSKDMSNVMEKKKMKRFTSAKQRWLTKKCEEKNTSFISLVRVYKGYYKIDRGNLVTYFGLPPKPPNLEGTKIRGWKEREGNILSSLPSNFLNHARGGAHFPSPPLPFPQTKQALRVKRHTSG